jgi:hypothetical protein
LVRTVSVALFSTYLFHAKGFPDFSQGISFA